MKDSYRRRKASLMSIIAGLEDSDLADQDVVEIDELDESIPEEIDVEDYEADDEDPFVDVEEDQPVVEEEGDSDIVAGEIEEEIEDIESSIRASEHNIRRKLARKLMAEEEACDDSDESDSVLEEIGNVEASIEASIDRIAKGSKDKDKDKDEDEGKGKGAKQKKRDKSCVAYDINNTGAGAVPTTSTLYKTKVNPTSLSKIRGLKEKTKVALVQTLDRIATELEDTGHVRQAFELDKISDQLED